MIDTMYFTLDVGAAKRGGHMTVLWTKLVQTYSQHREGPVQVDMWISTATDRMSSR